MAKSKAGAASAPPEKPKPAEPPAPAPRPEPDVNAIAEALARPFGRDEVHWKPQTVKDNRALVIAYIDARTIQDRLDEVLGVMGWQDGYDPLPDGSVVCRLRVRIGSEWITKEDVGGQSEQPDEGDRRKAAFSDALKRAAVKFGVGRYLYRLKPQWVDYDAQKRRIVGTPVLAEEKPAPEPPAPTPRQQAAGKVYVQLMDGIRRAVTQAALDAVAEEILTAKKSGLVSPEQHESLKLAGEQRRASIDERAERLAIQGEPTTRAAAAKAALQKKGRGAQSWEAALTACGCPDSARPEDLSGKEFDAVMTFLEAMPDAKPARK